jgi:hypothetical protein
LRVRARPEELYAAFLDLAALVERLPAAAMTGEIREFEARVGGGYRLSLFYPPNERAFRGKTSVTEDVVNVRLWSGTPMQDPRSRQLRHDRSGLRR